MEARIVSLKNDFEKLTEDMLSKTKSFQGAAARVYPLYQKLQTERFMSEGASEGMPWDSLTSKYQERKQREFVSFPGSGQKMMIATSTLAGAVIGPNSGMSPVGIEKHRALFLDDRMEISVEMSGVNAQGKDFSKYPVYADQKRPVMEFSDQSIELLRGEIAKFLLE